MKLTVSEPRFRSQLHAAVGNVITPAEMLEIIGKLNAVAETVPDEDEVMDLLDVEIRSNQSERRLIAILL
jgi:hypothetical protein